MPSPAPSSAQDPTGGGRSARKGQAVLVLVLSNDVLDAGVQEHVLVLQERKGGQSQVSDRDLQVTHQPFSLL